MRVDPRDIEEPRSIDELFVQVSKLHRDLLHGALVSMGLHRGQPPLLFALLEQDGRTHSELAESLLVTPATISRMVQRMERTGFVERRSDADDERLSRVFLTQAGRDLDVALHDLWRTIESVTFCGFSEQDLVTLARLLRIMRGNLASAASRYGPATALGGPERATSNHQAH